MNALLESVLELLLALVQVGLEFLRPRLVTLAEFDLEFTLDELAPAPPPPTVTVYDEETLKDRVPVL